MKKMLKKYFIANLGLLCMLSVIFPSTLTAYASELPEEQKATVTRVSNDTWLAFEQEFNQMIQSKKQLTGNTSLSEEEAFYLINKYDGAQSTVYISGRASYSEMFKTGGYNAFASSKSSMANLRDDYGTCATLLQSVGVLGGAMAGGPAGALLGLIGSTILGTRFRDANSDMKKWINVGSSKGSCRITATDEFPIASLNTLTQSPIQKL